MYKKCKMEIFWRYKEIDIVMKMFPEISILDKDSSVMFDTL